MKFFSNLPKTTFASSIGNFTISDFFTYLDVENIFINKTEIIVDNKSTLIEAAYNTYNDANSMWAFLAANNTINPFDLLAENVVLFAEQNQQKINFLLFPTQGATVGGVAFPIGSLVVPYVGNTGSTSSYGSTGNFNIDGQFARIQNMSFYDGNMTIGQQFGGTGSFINSGSTAEQVVVLKLNDDGSYSWGGVYYTSNKKSAPEVVVYIENVEEGQTIYKQPVTGNVTVDDLLGDSGPTTELIQQVTIKEVIDNTSKTINAYVTSELGTVRSSFITAKYN